MKEDKLPSGRFMEGDLKELLHFSANFHLLPLSFPPTFRPILRPSFLRLLLHLLLEVRP